MGVGFLWGGGGGGGWGGGLRGRVYWGVGGVGGGMGAIIGWFWHMIGKLEPLSQFEIHQRQSLKPLPCKLEVEKAPAAPVEAAGAPRQQTPSLCLPASTVTSVGSGP
uniref:Uncharacterized protein n=1 Tax=Knipowitschia caucasica TaxID=637954 RepID=A0AAV2K5I0_KNICA